MHELWILQGTKVESTRVHGISTQFKWCMHEFRRLLAQSDDYEVLMHELTGYMQLVWLE
jgi:hypothetical protein